MQIWLDSINTDLIQKAKKLGVLYGVTTNPSILAKAPNPIDTLKTLLEIQDGPITVQVVGQNPNVMIRQGLKLHEISPRIIVKVPVTNDGLETIHHLSSLQIKTMATVVFHSHQALLACSAGADYIAPYLSHMQKADPNGIGQLQTMKKMIDYYPLKTQILVASIQNLDQISLCLDMGINAVTLKDQIFIELIQDHELTTQRVELFSKDWSEEFEPSFWL